MVFKKVRKLFSKKKPFKLGDRVKCPHCGTVIILVKFGYNIDSTNWKTFTTKGKIL